MLLTILGDADTNPRWTLEWEPRQTLRLRRQIWVYFDTFALCVLDHSEENVRFTSLVEVVFNASLNVTQLVSIDPGPLRSIGQPDRLKVCVHHCGTTRSTV